MKEILKVLRNIVGALSSLFVLSMIVYFFNLDMKLLSKIGPILNKHYDRIKRDRHL